VPTLRLSGARYVRVVVAGAICRATFENAFLGVRRDTGDELFSLDILVYRALAV